MITQEEVAQYAKLTLKQYGFGDHSVVFMDMKKCLGRANPWDKKVELSPNALVSFSLFRFVLLHEIAHLIQFQRMGGSYQVNGRNNFHGKVFRQVCREMGIPYKMRA